MSIQNRKTVRDRIVTLLKSITAVTDTKYTVMTRIRSQAQDYEGFVMRVRLQSSAGRRQDGDTRILAENWLIELFSPKTGIGNEALKEDQMYSYADLINTLFIEYDRLNDVTTKQGLLGVSNAEISSESVIWQADASLDEDGQVRSRWSFSLTITREESC